MHALYPLTPDIQEKKYTRARQPQTVDLFFENNLAKDTDQRFNLASCAAAVKMGNNIFERFY